MRTRSPSSWKGCGTQEGAGEREQVTLREGTVLFRGGKGKLMGEQLKRRECDRIVGCDEKDLTWGSRMPQDCLYIQYRKG